MKRIIDNSLQESFRTELYLEEKSTATIEKYVRDVRVFALFAGGLSVDRKTVIAYKNMLGEKYAATSANSMLAALNSFFRFCGWHDLIVKQFRVQRQIFRHESRELTRKEYFRLVGAAQRRGDKRLCLILQTICGTGIRVSELVYLTAEAVRKGEVQVNCKGKLRYIFILPELRKKLSEYAKSKGIKKGCIFVTSGGKPMDRISIWRAMKSLCHAARVCPTKVFPHNLRHLFAFTFYSIHKDIVSLADLLGHSGINTTRIYTVTTGAEHRTKMADMHLIL